MRQLLYSALFLMASFTATAQGVTVGTNNPPDPSAILDVQSSSKGFLVPRLTTTQRNNIVSPASGLEIYNTTTNCLQMYLPISGWRDVLCDCLNPPSSAFTFPNSITQNAPAVFNATTPGMNYSWTFQGGTPPNSTQQNPSVTWSSSGTYTVTLTVTDNTGCSSTTTHSITVTNCPPPGGNNTTFAYTGSVQFWTVPVCVTSITVDVLGAQGGTDGVGTGGLGGRAQGDIVVTPGEVLEVYVGGQGISATSAGSGGFNGGGGVQGVGLAGTGGGASDIRRGSTLNDRLVVAGGGGGGTASAGQTRLGGAGGGNVGGDGGTWNTWPQSGGKGGTQFAGGAAGVACCHTPTPGSFGIGGQGQGDSAGGGGGGGGWYGGGGGLFGGGGGGSSYLGGVTNGTTQSGVRSGNGQIIITY